MMTTPAPEALQTREQMLNDLRMERAAGNIPAPTPTDSGEVIQGDADDTAFLRDLAARLFKWAAPVGGFDQGDVDRLYAIARNLDHRLAFSRPEAVGEEALVEREIIQACIRSLEWWQKNEPSSFGNIDRQALEDARAAIQAISAPTAARPTGEDN